MIFDYVEFEKMPENLDPVADMCFSFIIHIGLTQQDTSCRCSDSPNRAREKLMDIIPTIFSDGLAE